MATANNGVLDGIRRIGARFRDLTIDGGLPGAPLGFRFRGATPSGPPQSGTWNAGDQVPDRTGNIWICITGGTGPSATWCSAGTATHDVTGYGATGNGSADDTLAIQAALNAAGSIYGSDTAWVPCTPAGYLCGALTIPPGVRFLFELGAKLTAPATLATSWLYGTAHVVHQGSAVIGGTFDATAVTNANVIAIIDFGSVTDCPNLRIQDNRTINAPRHGIFVTVGAASGTGSLEMKWITRNSIVEHGIVQTGFGIYCDYMGNILIEDNYVYTAGVDDSIELGHSGPRWLGINAHMRAVNNYCTGGQLQFPFSDYAEIVNNTVNGNTIQNDGNTANYVQIIGNKVMGAAPVSTWGGISHWGTNGQIIGNYITITQGNGIGGSWSYEIVANNYITSTASPDAGYGINPGGGGQEDSITGNVIDGNFLYGMYVPMAESVIAGNAITAFNGIQIGGSGYVVIVGNSLNVANISLLGTPGPGSVIFGNTGALWGRILFPASIAAGASLNIPPGTAPTSPASGDMWNNGGNLYYWNGTSAQEISPPAAQVAQQIFTV
jgi:hypothetical protein